MNPFTTLVIILILLFFGINLAANNAFNAIIVKTLFYESNASKGIVRLMGVGVLGSIVLILMNMPYYAIVVNIVIIIAFTFLTIQGRSKVKQLAENRKKDLAARHKAEMDQRKIELERTRLRKIKELEEDKNKPQSVTDMKKQLWNDGSMTNKDLINQLNK